MNNERGMSLVEILVGMLIMVILLAGIAQVMKNSSSVVTLTFYREEGLRDAKNIINLLTKELRTCKSIDSVTATSITYTNAQNVSQQITLDSSTDKHSVVINGTDYGRYHIQNVQFAYTAKSGNTPAYITINIYLYKEDIRRNAGAAYDTTPSFSATIVKMTDG